MGERSCWTMGSEDHCRFATKRQASSSSITTEARKRSSRLSDRHEIRQERSHTIDIGETVGRIAGQYEANAGAVVDGEARQIYGERDDTGEKPQASERIPIVDETGASDRRRFGRRAWEVSQRSRLGASSANVRTVFRESSRSRKLNASQKKPVIRTADNMMISGRRCDSDGFLCFFVRVIPQCDWIRL